jgi:hypothetical protein
VWQQQGDGGSLDTVFSSLTGPSTHLRILLMFKATSVAKNTVILLYLKTRHNVFTFLQVIYKTLLTELIIGVIN